MQNFIDWNVLDFRKSQGKEKLRCPSCDESRSDKKDKSLLVNHNDGYGKCFYCDALTFKESKSNEERTKVDFKIPSQNWRNYTSLSDKMVKWLESRKIPQSTAIDLGWTEETHYQPALSKNVTNLVFNFFEGETLVNKKYRSANKKFTQSAGTKSIFYNINAAIGSDEVYIVEGEFDVASLHSIGIKNVISVPNGANDNDQYWEQSESYLKSVKRFVIAVDNDEKGKELKDRIAQRLGRWRCSYIEWNGKDANDDLISGVLEKTAKDKKRFPVSGTFNVNELMPEILDLYDNGLPKTFYPKDRCFAGMKDVFSVMRGQLNVSTGIPSHGKSSFTDWYVLNLIKDYDLKASWFSPEHNPMSLYQTNIIEKVTGKNFWGKCNGNEVERVTKEDIKNYEEWANERIYLTDAINGDFPTWDWLFEKFKEQMYSYGIDIFIIDAFNKVLLEKGNRLEEISKVLTKLTHFAQSNNVFIFLVAHPTKMQKNEKGIYSVPTLYDVSGSADFRNMTHNGYTIYRHFGTDDNPDEFTEFINMKTKFSFQGSMEKSVRFEYCLENGRFYSNGIEPKYNMIEGEPERSEKELVMMSPEDAFGDDDIPF